MAWGDLVSYLVCSMVEHPDDVRVDVQDTGRGVELLLSVHPSDIGRVIGRHGRTAVAIRSILVAAATKARVRVDLHIADEDLAPAHGDEPPPIEPDAPLDADPPSATGAEDSGHSPSSAS